MVRYGIPLGYGYRDSNGKIQKKEYTVVIDTDKDQFLGYTKHSYYGKFAEYSHKMTPSEMASKETSAALRGTRSTKDTIYYSYNVKNGVFYNGYFPPAKEDFVNWVY